MLTTLDVVIILASMALVIGVGVVAGANGPTPPRATSSAATACPGG